MHAVLHNLVHSSVIGNGFLPTRGSVMLDFVAVVMLIVCAVLAYSIYQVRNRKNPRLHRMIQLVTAIVMTFALVAFEVDMRFFTDWRELAKPSPYFDSGVVSYSLLVHLLFAIPTPFVWGAVIWMALSGFKSGYSAANFNRIHRWSGRVAAGMMFMTAITGWIFYYVAFVAS